jgi:ssDNA-binding Zn-finger/Zn-ribbon topoisomerase 1
VLEPRFPAVVTALDHTCPLCSFQVVDVKAAFSVTVCPGCKKNPPAQFFSPEARTDCRDCTNSACALAKGTSSRPVRLCPSCRKHSLVLRTNRKTGSPFLSCSHYPACSGLVNLPPCQSATVAPEACEACSAKFGVPIQKLQLTFSGPGQAMGGPLSAAHCIAGCSTQYLNPMLLQANLGVRDLYSAGGASANPHSRPAPPPVAVPSSNLASSYQRMKSGLAAKENGTRCGGCGGEVVELTVKKDNENKGRPFVKCAAKPDCGFFKFTDEEGNRDIRGGGGGGAGAQKGTCYNCQQPGHFSSNCPNKGKGGGSSYSKPASAPPAAKKRVRAKK